MVTSGICSQHLQNVSKYLDRTRIVFERFKVDRIHLQKNKNNKLSN